MASKHQAAEDSLLLSQKAQQKLPPMDKQQPVAGKDTVSPVPGVPAVTAAATKETSPTQPAAAQSQAAATGSGGGTSPPQPSLLSDAVGVAAVRRLSAMAVDPGQAPPLRHAAFMLLQVLTSQGLIIRLYAMKLMIHTQTLALRRHIRTYRLFQVVTIADLHSDGLCGL